MTKPYPYEAKRVMTSISYNCKPGDLFYGYISDDRHAKARDDGGCSRRFRCLLFLVAFIVVAPFLPTAIIKTRKPKTIPAIDDASIQLDQYKNKHQQRENQQQRRKSQQQDEPEPEVTDPPSMSHNPSAQLVLGYVYDPSIPSFDEKLQNDLLDSYVKTAYPWEWWWYEHLNNEGINDDGGNITPTTISVSKQQLKGIPVELNLNFFKVFKIDTAESTADLVTWVKLRWEDPRLKWDPSEYGGLTKTSFWIEGGSGGEEASQIWTPDVYLWNQEEPISRTLANTYARCKFDGTCTWSRPGRVKATCKFDGLHTFPYDTLHCTLEFSTWSHSKEYIEMKKFDGIGFTKGGGDTAGETYNEFKLTTISCRVSRNNKYDGWPVVQYDIGFDRAEEPYIRGYIVQQILLTVCSIVSLWIPPNIGERLGLAITTVLAGIALDLVVSESLPKSKEFTWFNAFALGNTLMGILIVVQSAVVIYFYYCTGKTLRPFYIRRCAALYRKFRKSKSTDITCKDNNDSTTRSDPQSQKHLSLTEVNATSKDESTIAMPLGITGKSFIKSTSIIDESLSSIQEGQEEDRENGGNYNEQPLASSRPINSMPIVRNSSSILDAQTSESENSPEKSNCCDGFGLSSRRITRRSTIASYPSAGESNVRNFSRKYSAESFHNWAAITGLPNHAGFNQSLPPKESPPDRISKGDYNISVEEAIKNNVRWQMVSNRVDDYSRLVIPVLYIIYLTAMFSSTETFFKSSFKQKVL